MISPQFMESVAANLDYWRERTRALDESQLGALRADWPNLLRALSFSLELPELGPASGELAAQLFEFVERQARWRAWIPILERLQAAGGLPPSLRVRLLDHLGYLYRLERRLAEAVDAHRQAEALARAAGDPDELAHIFFSLCEDYRYSRDYGEAERWGLAALEVFLGRPARESQLAAVYNSLGLITQGRGELERSEAHFTRALELYRQVSRPTDQARALKNLAFTLEGRGQMDAALRRYAESRAILEPTTHELDKVMLELSFGASLFNQGRLEEAEAAFRRADSAYLRQSGIIFYQALTANNLGNVFLEQGRLAEAEAQLRRGAALWRQTDDSLELANTLGTLGELLLQRGQAPEAGPLLDEALALLSRYPDDARGRRLSARFAAQRQALPPVG